MTFKLSLLLLAFCMVRGPMGAIVFERMKTYTEETVVWVEGSKKSDFAAKNYSF